MKSYKLTDFGAPLTTVETPTPELSGTEVLLRVKAAGVCHSDIHIWEGSYDLGHGKRLSLGERGIPLPLTLGHETVGEVVATGPDAKDAKPGDVRLVYPWIGCAECAICKGGNEHFCATPRFLGVYCDGGYADHITVPHPRYLVDIGDLDPLVAAPYACSGVTTFSALKKVEDVMRHEPILIIGAGGLGLMALSLIKAMGGVGAIMVDIDERKREAALKAGAVAAIDGAAPDALRQIVKAAGGPIRAAIDLVGSSQTAALGFDSLGKGGKYVIVGLFGGEAPWSLPFIPMKAITIQGAYVGNLAETKELIDLVRRGLVPAIPVTPRPMAEATRTLEELRRGELVGRAVLTP